jgi:hypothetical protein
MRNGLILMLLFISLKGFSQITAEEILKELDSTETPKSHFKVAVGIGNTLFSVDNKTVNAQQTNNVAVITPSIGYFHKSGFSIAFTPYLVFNNGTSSAAQYAINPAYEYSKDSGISVGVSYTRFLIPDIYSAAGTPIQNDFYGSMLFKKHWLRPGFALGYGNGKYKDIIPVDTVIRVNNQNTHFKFIDTATTKLNNDSVIGTIEHSFEKKTVFKKGDELTFTPQLLANLGGSTSNISSSASGTFSGYLGHRTRKFSKKNKASDNSTFQLESIGMNFDLGYEVGNFTVESNLYLDYFIPQTDYKRLNQVFTINFIYSF